MRLQQIYMAKIRTLEDNLARSTKKCRELEARRARELEGFHRDLDGVKRKTRIYDEYLHRVKNLIDEKPQDVIDLAQRGEDSELDVVPLKQEVQKLETELERIQAKHFLVPGHPAEHAAEAEAEPEQEPEPEPEPEPEHEHERGAAPEVKAEVNADAEAEQE